MPVPSNHVWVCIDCTVLLYWSVLNGTWTDPFICIARLGQTPTEKCTQSVVVVVRLVRVNVEITAECIKICGKEVMSYMDPRHATTAMRGSDFMINMWINWTCVPINNQEKNELKKIEGSEWPTVPKHRSLFLQEIRLREICISVCRNHGKEKSEHSLRKIYSGACCPSTIRSRARSVLVLATTWVDCFWKIKEFARSWIVQTHATPTVLSQPPNITRRTDSRKTNTQLFMPLRPSCRSATALFIRCSASWLE